MSGDCGSLLVWQGLGVSLGINVTDKKKIIEIMLDLEC